MPRRSLARPVLAVALLALVIAPADRALALGEEPVTREDRRPSYAVEADALAFVAKFSRAELSRDEVFIAAMQDLARSGLSARSQADAFALMQSRLGWMFAGTSRLFPGMGYAQTTAMMLSTWVQYQRKMPAGIEVGPLLALAREGRAGHPLRASNALLLAVILNREAAKEAVGKAIDLKAIDSAPVPAIDLHNTALAAALTLDAKVVASAVALLPEIRSEESREDLIAVTSIYKDDGLRAQVEDFLKGAFPASFDNSVQTAIQVLAHAGPVDHFRAFYKSLGEGAKDDVAVDKLRKFWDGNFRGPLESADPKQSPLKIWDGFTVAIENDGAWIKYGEAFRTWLTFK